MTYWKRKEISLGKGDNFWFHCIKTSVHMLQMQDRVR